MLEQCLSTRPKANMEGLCDQCSSTSSATPPRCLGAILEQSRDFETPRCQVAHFPLIESLKTIWT